MVGQLREIDALALKAGLEQGRYVLVDVREEDEAAHERIAGAVSLPLTRFAAASLPDPRGRKLALHCASGARSTKAAQTLLAGGRDEVVHLKGGLAAWKAAGLPVVKGGGALPVMRQVQIAAGSLALLGVALGFLVHPGFFLVSGAVGAGLLRAGLTGKCMMADLLMKLPYNRA
jgi:rhodanese-related sulfurtransferase